MISAVPALSQDVFQLRCGVANLSFDMPTGFEADFCQTLADNLSRDLGVPFHIAKHDAWAGDGKALAVDLRMASNARADVTILIGSVAAGVFAERDRMDTSLQSTDAPLRPAASRALVRPIGLRMGLVR